MQPKTKELATRVRQALLALSEQGALETIDQWLKDLDELSDDVSVSDSYYEMFGYRVQSGTTGEEYRSHAELDRAEPDSGEVVSILPEARALYERLRRMPPHQVYHLVVSLASRVFPAKPFASRWGEPPLVRGDGYCFMEHLIAYLSLKREVGPIPTEQFEARYRGDLELLVTASTSGDGALTSNRGDPREQPRSLLSRANGRRQRRWPRKGTRGRAIVSPTRAVAG